MYILAQVAPEMAIRKQDVIQWSTPEGKLKGSVRVGFMSQVSPDGQYVVTTVNPASLGGRHPRAPPSNYYVANFKDYRFLQVFYPDARDSGLVQPRDRRAAAAPRRGRSALRADGRGLESRWPVPGIRARRSHATPIRRASRWRNSPTIRTSCRCSYDLYRIPFHDGQGGQAEPIAGASRNGMSNTFPQDLAGRALDRVRGMRATGS